MNRIRYIITNGTQYLYSGEKGAKLVDKIEDATIWDKKKSAQNVFTTYKHAGKSQVLGNTAQKKDFMVKEITSTCGQFDNCVNIEREY